LFGRFPDEAGLVFWEKEMNSGTSHGQILQKFLASEEFNENLQRLLQKNRLDIPFLNSFSQYKEDRILIEHLVTKIFENPFVVDVGAHSIIGSNSILFSHYLKWPTLLIEANSDLIPNLQQDFPEETKILNLAISTSNGFVEFYKSRNSYVSSTDKEHALSWGETIETTSVLTRRLPEVLEENEVPFDFGLLTIDIEGLDFEVIHDLIESSNFRPRFIIAEMQSLPEDIGAHTLNTINLIPRGYEIIAETHANTILAFKQIQPLN
jgi:FkbM family methyltransferase